MSFVAPAISVIMPAYNCEKYLRPAIESILNQSFHDFEFIIINDGSTDETEEVIQGYHDSRIIYLKNEVNKGLIYSLNRGISEAKGKYIARMDGDDISFPERFEKQLDYLEKNEQVDVLATQVGLIDERGDDMGFWDDDIKHSSAEAIKKFLPINNCIAHPSVMGKKEIFIKYKYNPLQKLSEDYDLWLRLISDKKRIDKIPVILLKYRVLPKSLTRIPKLNVFLKIMKIKLVFVHQQLSAGKFNKFILETFLYSTVDAFKGLAKLIFNLFKNLTLRTMVILFVK